MPDAPGVVRDLALQVVEAHGVVVDHADGADAGGCQIHRDGAAEPAGADQQDAGRLQLLLALAADLLQHEVALVALDFQWCQCHGGI